MKIRFTKLPTNDGTIKVSLDGGNSFKDYNVADIHEDGIPLADSQDYEKIQIQAPANILKNLNVVSGVKVDDGSGIDENNSLPITTIYYEIYDGGCGSGFRLKESGCGYYPDYDFNPRVLYVQNGGSYISLDSLCEYDGHFNSLSDTSDFTGDLYVHADISGSCPYESYYIRVPYRLEKW